ncbi:MAG: YdcF family protein [Bilophila wadsworthia]
MGQGWYGAIGKLAIAALLIGAVLIWRAEAWLHVDVPLEHADVIVVLGGESGQRVIGAAELYQALPESLCDGLRRRWAYRPAARHGGVPDAACESQSRSTYENAVLTKTGSLASRSVMLVTSWFHSRRALAVFRDVWPEVTFGVYPVYAGATFTARFRIYEMGYIFSEYVKTLWYMVRYGIA